MLGISAPAAADVQPYQTNDFGGFHNILPPGENGTVTLPQLTQFQLDGTRPPNSSDQLAMYGDLANATPGLSAQDLSKYYKDASFGVKPEDVVRTYSPRSDVTIQRDKFGVPHIYGTTRAGTMFGAGYACAEDRLFLMDVLRHVGRANATAYLQGLADASANDRDQWQVAPYTEQDLQQQVENFPAQYGAQGQQLKEDSESYVEGVNQFIDDTKLDPSKRDVLYTVVNGGAGPDHFKATDVVAIASLVGGIFGKGGGGELDSALTLQEAQKRFGRKRGLQSWQDFRSAEDPEQPTTVRKRQFPYELTPKKRRKGSLAMPDPGTVKKSNVLVGASSAAAARNRGASRRSREAANLQSFLDGLRSMQEKRVPSGSNALLVSAKESQSGHPLAVFGPQTGYFAPQLLMEEDIHGPGVDARGASFVGTNVVVQLGRGRDYAWSATSAGQDIIDTFALPLCEASGTAPTISSASYLFRGQCRPIEVLDRDDTTPGGGGQRLRAERTALGLVTARATVGGKPVVYVKLRSTYFHEIDSAIGFMDFNNPDKIHNAQEWQQAASKIGYTFNWLYADDKDVAYFNSGNNPIRAKGVNPNFPTWAQFEWRGYDPDTHSAQFTSFRQHPRVINQDFLTSWNNKQAPGYRAADDNWGYQSTYRSALLDAQIQARIAGAKKITLPNLVDAMEQAGGTDLRGYRDLPWALRVIGPARKVTDPQAREAVDLLTEWVHHGTLRRDQNHDGTYEHSRAIQIMDAWWPLWVQGEFRPVLGDALYDKVVNMNGVIDDTPNGHGAHHGSAFQGGFYGYVRKDLRTVLGGKTKQRVRGRYSRVYCGGGSLKACRGMLLDTLLKAARADTSKVYGGDKVCSTQPMVGPPDPLRKPDNQFCWDTILQSPVGLVEQPLIQWINRPTFQQANEIPSHRPR